MNKDIIDEQCHKIYKELEEDFKKITNGYNDYRSCDIISDKAKELETVRNLLINRGYESAIGYQGIRKKKRYNTTDKFLDSIYPCDAFGEQCCLYCKKYGVCDGFN